MFTARPTVDCRCPATDGRSCDGILASVDKRDVAVSDFGFTVCSTDVAFWSRSRREWSDRSVAFAAAAAGHAVAVVVIRAVVLPAAVLLVVTTPADGCCRDDDFRGGKIEPRAVLEDW